MPCAEIRLNERFSQLAMQHPCLGRALNKGRVHLPVSPACNIKCRFCTRGFNASEYRPGVTRQILSVEDVGETVKKALALCPQISVVGIAGPGDALASDHALRCFIRLHREFPELIGCMSTNGLMLPEYMDDIVRAGIRSVTVTVNAVEASLLSQIVERITLDGKSITGEDGAKALLTRQFQGIRRLAEKDVLVKINTVLIPQINGNHIDEIARAVAGQGASIINIIPLIPQGDFAHMEPPDCEQISQARADAEQYLPVFRHCQHCRADACGLLGENSMEDRLYQHISCENTFSHG